MRAMIALLLMLWLPLQGFAAVAMPFCQHAMRGSIASGSVADPQAQHTAHDHHQAARASMTDAQHTSDGALLACNDCGACHLACTPTAPSSTPAVDSDATYAYGGRNPALPPLFIPEQPHHPPLPARV